MQILILRLTAEKAKREEIKVYSCLVDSQKVTKYNYIIVHRLSYCLLVLTCANGRADGRPAVVEDSYDKFDNLFHRVRYMSGHVL